MYKKAVLFLFLLNGYVICDENSVATSWMDFSEALRDSMGNCSVNLELFGCLRQSTMDVFDKIVASDVIPLTLNVRFIRKHHGLQKKFDSEYKKRSGTAVTTKSWSGHILKNVAMLFRTHALTIDLTQQAVSGRGPNRRRNQMLPMMILGVTALGAFTIPMGFQFLSVISGKALLIAKMALILAVMNGAKRVASSGVHYGLYHAADAHQHGYNYLDRVDNNRPRSADM